MTTTQDGNVHEVAGNVGVLYIAEDSPRVYLDGLRDRDGTELSLTIDEARSLVVMLDRAADVAAEDAMDPWR